MRISYQEVQSVLSEILQHHQFNKEKAELCSRLFAETTRDGVYSHGLNRFPRFIRNIRDGYVKPGNEPVQDLAHHAHEVWDGQAGPGNLNAWQMMERAMELAKKYSIGMVSLRNTNHWMRGGTYGWQAADAGYAAICATNTEPNMPPWGGTEPKIGNNPLVIAMPHKPAHLVLDMAMSQYSFGKMEDYALQHKDLPYPGGFNHKGELSYAPEEILESRQPLPIGYWKGAGLSLMIDLLVSTLSRGNATVDIGRQPVENAVSQLFIAIDVHHGGNLQFTNEIAAILKDEIHKSKPFSDISRILYPGERTLHTRSESLKKGLLVNEKVWREILQLKVK